MKRISPIRWGRFFLAIILFLGLFNIIYAQGTIRGTVNKTISGVSNAEEIPRFQVDADWPQRLPNNWVLGQVSGVDVDSRDHIWIVQRPSTLTPRQAGASQDPPISRCCVPAPPVIEFSPEGSVVQAWGGSGEGYEWTNVPHGIYIDYQDNVWIAGGWSEHQVLKFTKNGEFLLQIGEKQDTGGSNNHKLLGGPTDMVVDPKANEVYIADGYKNRRVIVFDAKTGEYQRHWGAYGNKPHDRPLGDYDPTELSQQFRGPVHGIAISNDSLIYITDRMNDRVQVFKKNGKYVEEVIIRPETLSMGSTWDVAFSEDPEQRWLYVADGTNSIVWVLDRSSLDLKGYFGDKGKNAGYFGWVHNLSVNSRGDIFTTEVEHGKRIQKFSKEKKR